MCSSLGCIQNILLATDDDGYIRNGSPELLSSQDLILPNLDRYLRQGPGCGSGLYRRTSGGVEDRAVTWAGELAVPVVHRAASVSADRRVRCKVVVFEVHQHRRLL